MSLIYSSVKKGLPLLECPYFYYGIDKWGLSSDLWTQKASIKIQTSMEYRALKIRRIDTIPLGQAKEVAVWNRCNFGLNGVFILVV